MRGGYLQTVLDTELCPCKLLLAMGIINRPTKTTTTYDLVKILKTCHIDWKENFKRSFVKISLRFSSFGKKNV